MTQFITFAFLSVVLTAAPARATNLPPASGNDGILIAPSATNPNLSNWKNSALWNYRIAPDNSLIVPTTTGFDTLGSKWSELAPSKDALNTSGGVVRAVFLGESTGWLDAVGYTFSTSPYADSSFTLASVVNPAAPLSPAALSFGDSVAFPFAVGEASAFDLWFRDSNGFHGAFSPANSATTGLFAVTWMQAALLVPTLPLFDQDGSPIETPTWLVNISDGTNSYRLALQSSNLVASALEPVPEPSTYGYCAAFGLVALALLRRRRTSRK